MLHRIELNKIDMTRKPSKWESWRIELDLGVSVHDQGQDKQLLSLHCDSVGLRTGVDQLKIIINWNGGLGGGSGVQILFS